MTVGWHRERAATRVMIGGMLVVIGAFLVSTLYARQRSNTTVQAVSIAINGAPSVRLLAEAKSELRRIRSAGLRLILQHDASALPELRQARARLDAAVLGELETPEYPGERPLGPKLLASMGALDGVIARSAHEDPSPSLLAALEGAADDLDRHLDALHEANASGMQADANLLLKSQQAATTRLYWIGLIDLAVAGLVLLLMIRILRRYLALAERRSHELEFFAVQVAHDIFNPLVPIRITLESCDALASTERLHQSIARAEHGLERLRRAADELVAFARAGEPPRPGDQASPRACFSAIAGEDARLAIEIGDDRAVHADPIALDAVVRALLREAERQAAPAAPIRVSVGGANGNVRVELRFSADAQLPLARELFQPRLRGRSSGAPGLQLDLVAAREIVTAHGGCLGLHQRGPDRVLWFALPAA
jgi:signal transduction histidine kinase